MRKELTTGEYQALAELRYRIRRFLREGDTVASEAGLEPQQYLLLLMIRGIPDGQEATVSNLAERLVLKHRSEEHTSELQSPCNLVCRLLLEKKNKHTILSFRIHA